MATTVVKQPYPLSAAVKPYGEDEIEVPVEPDVPALPTAAADDEEEIPLPPTAPVDIPQWTDESIAALQAEMDAQQHAKDQLVALAANVAHVETVINSLAARVEALEAK